ncbi:hypothetical protein VTL71DRAFT_12186 [Oculimacula yallundae]|uniref:Uncharacterized protein n=1 Tax=Oculimacula yallundae TaxID=86028 RepID=A0ABR4CS60_9HELO
MAPSKPTSSSTKETIKNVAPAPTEGDTDGSGLAPGKGEEVGEGKEKEKGGNGGKGGEKKTLRQIAMDKLDENPSQLGDPISLKAETSASEPTDQDRGAKGGSGKSKL